MEDEKLRQIIIDYIAKEHNLETKFQELSSLHKLINKEGRKKEQSRKQSDEDGWDMDLDLDIDIE